MKWTVYATQVLTGLAGIGAILLADNVTKLHVLVAVILGISLVVSLMVVARAEADADRNRSHLDTLLRAMELPYFIIRAISKLVGAVAKQKGWQLTQQENFQQETVYQFQSADGQLGRLVMPAQEFKDLWILDETLRTKKIESRLFASVGGGPPEAIEEDMERTIREAIAEHFRCAHWVSQAKDEDGTRRYGVRLDQNGRVLKTVVFSKQRFDEFLSMLPIRRDQVLADEVTSVLSAAP